jgi:hypothetical protein
MIKSAYNNMIMTFENHRTISSLAKFGERKQYKMKIVNYRTKNRFADAASGQL